MRAGIVLMVVMLGLIAAGLLLNSTPADAQGGPNPFANPKNLQVLPADIDPGQLREYMMGAAMGLGVRCWACHIGEEGQELSTFDFASDEKEMKQVAREMLKMTIGINAEHMPAVAKIEGKEESASVRCVTCHRGEKKPTLERPSGQG